MDFYLRCVTRNSVEYQILKILTLDVFLVYFLGFQVDMMDRVTSFPSYDLETSAAGTGGSGDFSGKLESAEQMCSPLQTCSASFNDWFPQTSVASRPERIGISHFETPGCSTASSFSEGDGYPFLDHRHSTDFDILEGQAGSSFGCMVSQIDPKCK